MKSIVVILDPGKLANPDLGIRYDLPDAIAEHTKNQITDEGFDYVDGDRLAIFLKVADDSCIPEMLDYLGKNQICDNHVLDSAVIVYSDGSGYRPIHPQGYDGDLPDLD